MKYHLYSGFSGNSRPKHTLMPPPTLTRPSPPGAAGRQGGHPPQWESSLLRGLPLLGSTQPGGRPCSASMMHNQLRLSLVRPPVKSMITLGIFPPFLCRRTDGEAGDQEATGCPALGGLEALGRGSREAVEPGGRPWDAVQSSASSLAP